MDRLKRLTTISFLLCIAIGLGISFVIGEADSTYHSELEGDIGYLASQEKLESDLFDLAFDTTFKGRVHVSDQEKVKMVSSFINIYEYGEHVAQFPLGSLHYDDEFPFDYPHIDFVLGGINHSDEEEIEEGFYWTNVVQVGEGSLRSHLDMADEGRFSFSSNEEVGAVNDGELVLLGVALMEGEAEMQSISGDRDRFYHWAENKEKVFAYEVLISSGDEMEETWDKR
ncbi:hypothetical protein [Salipaludibacillus daqingensis]|uniref:hypothetical protein n=1 Tax=Salipaludibacillus daqingensis TaxID=3041001 RepID=UPI00247527F8|nr:hypothetical protein [Salipaludibacillus daqingensis]